MRLLLPPDLLIAALAGSSLLGQSTVTVATSWKARAPGSCGRGLRTLLEGQAWDPTGMGHQGRL